MIEITDNQIEAVAQTVLDIDKGDWLSLDGKNYWDTKRIKRIA